MRKLFLSVVALFAVVGFAAASNVEVKGPHICCKQCVNVVGKILEKVEGVSNVNADVKSRTVTFTAKDSAAAKAGFKALVDGGFFGTATEDGKAIALDVATPAKAKAQDVVVVKDVHVCCGLCQKAVNGIFKDAKVSYEGTGAQRTVRIEGANLEPAAVIQALRKGGFNGKIE